MGVFFILFVNFVPASWDCRFECCARVGDANVMINAGKTRFLRNLGTIKLRSRMLDLEGQSEPKADGANLYKSIRSMPHQP